MLVSCVKCMSATHAAAYPALLSGRLADAIITDPPFLLLTPRRRSAPRVRERKLDDPAVLRFPDTAAYAAFSRAWLAAAVPHLKRSGTLVIFSNALGRPSLVGATAALGWSLEGAIPWAKFSSRAGAPAGHSSANEVLLRVYEHALVFRTPATARPPTFLTQGSLALLSGYSDAPPDPSKGRPHPHEKPRAALEPLLLAFSSEGGVVLDPFAGSGAIPSAAQALRRTGLGMELRADWAAAAQRRLEAGRV